MAFPRSPASTVSSYVSTPTLSSCPSSSISTGCSTPATPNPFAVAAISPAAIRHIVSAGHAGEHKPALAATGTPEFTQGKKLQQHQDHTPALAATGAPDFTQGQKHQQHQDLPESAAKFPKQENPALATTVHRRYGIHTGKEASAASGSS
ncbi:uncharacterized protein LOC119335253 [Triticum dicoccoides]|uniref:uncharacterized protein LOC119335253 n=1 Tax=Triticum dicoccoides TaxID=85692 RepID=UPI001891AC3F|nr:uncharacterized protein LOC119335253 [Triticum dicoccoides]